MGHAARIKDRVSEYRQTSLCATIVYSEPLLLGLHDMQGFCSTFLILKVWQFKAIALLRVQFISIKYVHRVLKKIFIWIVFVNTHLF